MKAQLAVSLFATMLLVAPVHAEKFYKWQDEQGTWHYSKTPPKETEAQALNVRAQGATPTEAELAAKAEADKNAATKAMTDGSESANCKRARENLQILLNNTKVQKDVDGDGKEEILSEDEQMAEVSATRRQVEKYCGN
jgi:uncharacterized iron-regulated membrane protein